MIPRLKTILEECSPMCRPLFLEVSDLPDNEQDEALEMLRLAIKTRQNTRYGLHGKNTTKKL